MDEVPDIEMSIIESAFRSLRAESENYLITVSLRESTEGSISFHIRLSMKNPVTAMSYPQMSLSLERHDPGKGHEGIHFQMKIHKIENRFNIGSMWIRIEADSDEELMNISRGFVCSLYRFLSGNVETTDLVDRIFIRDIVDEWMINTRDFTGAIARSIRKHGLEIKDGDGKRSYIRMENELDDFLSTRRELVPIFKAE